MNITIRSARKEDAQAIQAIYAYYVNQTAISFEYDAPDTLEIQKRMDQTLQKYPYIVAEENGCVIGFAYAHVFYDRAAYDHSAEVSIYLDALQKKKGVGRKLYQALEEEMKKRGFKNLYACIASPIEEKDPYVDTNSIDFHTHMGYRLIGEFRRCGYKFNRYYNMVWMEKLIG